MAAVEVKRQTATVDCPKSMVGRVIGKNGETIKALQTYSGALIQIDQTVEPTKVTISGTAHSLSLAVSMVTDIVKGTFKGFALLRQVSNPGARPAAAPVAAPSVPQPQARPVYAPGYGLIPPSQLYGSDDRSTGMVPAGAQQAQLAWPQGGQMVPQQLLLGVPHQGAMLRPMSSPQALLAGGMGMGMGMVGGLDEAAMMGGYGLGAPMYAAYPSLDAAAYAGLPMGAMGMMASPGQELMYAAAMAGAMPGAPPDGGARPAPSGAAAAPAGVGGVAARMYGAAGGSGGPGGRAGGGGRAGDGLQDSLPGASAAGNWVQVMDAEGKVFLMQNQGHSPREPQ